MKWILAIVVVLVGLSALAGAASFTGFGLPTDPDAVSVRLETPSVWRTYRGGTRSFGK